MTPLESCELRLSELFESHDLPSIQRIDTLSELLEWLSEQSRGWLPFSEKVIEVLKPVVPESDLIDLLADITARESIRRNEALNSLVNHLLKAGIPVELDRNSFLSVNHTSSDMDSPAFTYQGKIFLDLQRVDLEAPIHEYTHLWATALRISDPEEWQDIVRQMKESDLWERIDSHFHGSLKEDDLAEEVLATFSGKRGKERLERLGVSENNPLVRVMKKFWRAVIALFSHDFRRAEEIADMVLHDFLSDVNPRKTLQEPVEKAEYDRLNERRRDLFLGKRGLSRMDQDNLFGSRMDNLHAAERMESEGISAKRIKMATGWERGVDGFWRYEISPIQLKSLTRQEQAWKSGLPLESVLQAPELFRAYPDLREITVKATKMSATAAYNPSTNTIELNIDDLPLIATDTDLVILSEDTKNRIRGYLTHEIQHHIQNREGFATGSNCSQLAYYALKAKEEALKEPDRSAMKLARFMNLTEYVKRILDTAGSSYAVHYLSLLSREQIGVTEEIAERNALIRKIEAMTPEAFKELVAKAYKKRSTYNRWRRECEEKVYPIYDKLAGEVEARNASERIYLSERERKTKLGKDTMDYPEDEQYLFFKRGKPLQVGEKAAFQEKAQTGKRSR